MGSSDSDGGEAPLAELASAITAGAVRLAAATASWLRLVREFDARGGWHGVGIQSCAHWLAWQCGMGPGAAREHVRVARALADLPGIEAAFAAGRLSYSKVRALTRIAGPDCEAALVQFALSATASQTERFCRQWRRADDANRDDARRNELGLSFEHWYDDDGFLTLKIRMPAESGAALMTAIDSMAERDARRERVQAKKATARHEAIRAAGGTIDADVADRCAEDAAVGLVRERTAVRRVAALSALATAGADNDRRPGDPPRREVVVHVDASVLADDTAAGRAHYEGGPSITGTQARRLLCEATVVAMIEQGREPLAMGRRRRRATKAQRRALLRRDGGCTRPGCPETRIERLHAHHMRHWLFGGRTDVEGMVLLCDVDHGLVHEHDLVVGRRDGRLVVTDAGGHRVWGVADAAFAVGLNRSSPDANSGNNPYAGVHPIDATGGRRPDEPLEPAALQPAGPPSRPLGRHPAPAGPGRSRPFGGHGRRGARRHRRRDGGRLRPLSPAAPSVDAAGESRRLNRVLFSVGAPDRTATVEVPHERLDMAYAIGVLMGNRDLVRRLAAGEPLRS